MLSYDKPPPTPGSRHAALRVGLRNAAEEEAHFERQRLLHGPTTADERTLHIAARHARQVAAQRVRAADGPEGQLVHAVSDKSVRLAAARFAQRQAAERVAARQEAEPEAPDELEAQLEAMRANEARRHAVWAAGQRVAQHTATTAAADVPVKEPPSKTGGSAREARHRAALRAADETARRALDNAAEATPSQESFKEAKDTVRRAQHRAALRSEARAAEEAQEARVATAATRLRLLVRENIYASG